MTASVHSHGVRAARSALRDVLAEAIRFNSTAKPLGRLRLRGASAQKGGVRHG